jgi:hypothetical protein
MNGLLLAVTVVSVIAAVVSSAIAWRVTREERRRSNLRVAALSDAIYEGDSTRPSPAPATLFEDPAPARTQSYRAVAAIVASIVLLGTGMTFVTARSARRPAPAGATSATAADVPLELLALEHDREGDRLIVRGLVRNPVNGGQRRGLSAFVLLYRSDGRFLTSGAAPVPLAALAPGETTPFIVSVSGADDVERFRLSFRTNARVEPHVDRRVHLPGEGVTQ